MKYLHRDNFRHLTGHGRDVAACADMMLSKLDAETNGAVTKWLGMFDNYDSYLTGPFVAIVIDIEPATRRICAKFQDLHWRTEGGMSKSDIQLHVERYGSAAPRLLSVRSFHGNRHENIGMALPALLSTAPSVSNSFQVYDHTFSTDEIGSPIERARYIGVTKRGWRTRWAEHVRAANSGSHYRFHQAIRNWQGRAQSISHTVISCGLSEKKAMDMEESMIGFETLYPLGLNMIPGGNAGLAYLRKIGALGKNERISADDRQDVINRFFDRASRKGLPNPLAAANWLNSEYAEKVICAGPDRLKPQQIRDARYMASLGQDAQTIATRIDARNIAQVERLLSGSTYSRVA
jgi:hypothetical protein